MAPRSRNRPRAVFWPAISTISVTCFVALLVLAVMSINSGRLLDLESPRGHQEQDDYPSDAHPEPQSGKFKVCIDWFVVVIPHAHFRSWNLWFLVDVRVHEWFLWLIDGCWGSDDCCDRDCKCHCTANTSRRAGEMIVSTFYNHNSHGNVMMRSGEKKVHKTWNRSFPLCCLSFSSKPHSSVWKLHLDVFSYTWHLYLLPSHSMHQ